MKPESLVVKIVNRYIGVKQGYLGMPDSNRFTYKNHKDPDIIEGTTRERFIKIYLDAAPKDQSKIIKGILERFPIGEGPKTRTKTLATSLENEAIKLEKKGLIDSPNLEAEHIFELLEDADSLMQNRKASSAVDRLHTAFHGYLRELCEKENLSFNEKDDLVKLIKKIQNNHPKFNISIKSQEIQNIIKNLVSISDSLNPIRNQGSRAHPNKITLDEPEAILVINTIRTVISYLESKLK
jgi:hypothetical protein